MAIVKPFQAIRPEKKYVGKIAALPYDVYNRDEARAVVEENPLSFLAIDRAETAFPKEYDIYGEWVYKKAGELLNQWLERGYFVKATGLIVVRVTPSFAVILLHSNPLVIPVV